jgi:hypothetical protein
METGFHEQGSLATFAGDAEATQTHTHTLCSALVGFFTRVNNAIEAGFRCGPYRGNVEKWVPPGYRANCFKSNLNSFFLFQILSKRGVTMSNSKFIAQEAQRKPLHERGSGRAARPVFFSNCHFSFGLKWKFHFSCMLKWKFHFSCWFPFQLDGAHGDACAFARGPALLARPARLTCICMVFVWWIGRLARP